jgi:hypothetical protein
VHAVRAVKRRQPTWCAEDAHDWRRVELMLHLPTAEGTPELCVRACQRCPLAEVIHLVHLGGQGRLVTYEQWSVDPVPRVPGMQQTHIVWDKTREG